MQTLHTPSKTTAVHDLPRQLTAARNILAEHLLPAVAGIRDGSKKPAIVRREVELGAVKLAKLRLAAHRVGPITCTAKRRQKHTGK
jgi:hypothetical protein